MKKIIAVVGANGKMGSAVCKKLQNKFKIIKIDLKNSLLEAKNADLVVDFASAKSSAHSALFCAENKIKLIVGSTGQSEEEMAEIQNCSKVVPTLVCQNFSVGVFLMKQISDLILSQTQAEITIFEKHHSQKKDKPSGTAILLRENLQKKTTGEIPILSERGGSEIGTHKVDFYFGDELLSVTHQAFSREAFSSGVLLACDWLLSQSEPRLYFFDEVLSIKK